MADMIPAEIRKIAEDVQRMEDELFKKPPESKTPEQLAEEKAAAEKAEAEKKAAEEAAGVELTEEQKAEAEKKAAEEKAIKDAEGATDSGTDLEKANHKYKVLQGKYNKELPRERDARKAAEERSVSTEYENSILRKQISDLTARLEIVEKGGRVKKAVEDTAQVSDVVGDLENDPDIVFIKNEFPDVWKGLKKALNRTYDKALEGTVGKITKVEEKIKATEETTAKTAWTGFHKYLDDNIEGWRVANKDPEFAKWLEGEEKYSGLPKSVLIKQAISEMDGRRVADFFVDFAKSKEKPLETKKEEGSQVVADDKIKNAGLTPPKGQKTVPPKKPVDTKSEIFTQEDVAAFYERKRRGFYIGREAEGDAEEKRIERAMVEGRIQMTRRGL